jgi:hypothetical protein
VRNDSGVAPPCNEETAAADVVSDFLILNYQIKVKQCHLKPFLGNGFGSNRSGLAKVVASGSGVC